METAMLLAWAFFGLACLISLGLIAWSVVHGGNRTPFPAPPDRTGPYVCRLPQSRYNELRERGEIDPGTAYMITEDPK